jgi:hypothetical protein
VTPLVWWKANNSLAEEIAGATATWVAGTEAYSSAVGRTGFSLANSRVKLGSAEQLNFSGAFAIDVWVHPTNLSGWRTIMRKGNFGAAGYGIALHDGRVRAYHNEDRPEVSTAVVRESAAVLPVNRWSRITYSFDGSTARLYINGNEDSSWTGLSPQGAGSATSGLFLGGLSPIEALANFEGMIDDVALYESAIVPDDPAYFGVGYVPPMMSWSFDKEADLTQDPLGAGTAVNTATTWSAVSGGTASFNGSAALEYPPAAELLNDRDQVTIMAWVKAPAVGTNRGFISGKAPNGLENVLSFRHADVGKRSGAVNPIVFSMNTTNGIVRIESSANAQTTEWQHVAVTWRSGALPTLYINGQPDVPSYVGRSDGYPGIPTGTVNGIENFIIGKGQQSVIGWGGLVDDVAIYHRSLSQDEIKTAMHGKSVTFGAQSLGYAATNAEALTVNGFARGAVDSVAVEVAGTSTPVAVSDSWSTSVPLVAGQNQVQVIGTTRAGRVFKETMLATRAPSITVNEPLAISVRELTTGQSQTVDFFLKASGAPAAGVQLSLREPSGVVTTTTLRDDGVAPDVAAGDSIFSGRTIAAPTTVGKATIDIDDAGVSVPVGHLIVNAPVNVGDGAAAADSITALQEIADQVDWKAVGVTQAAVIRAAQSDPTVLEVLTAPETLSITVMFKSGLKGFVSFAPPGTRGGWAPTNKASVHALGFTAPKLYNWGPLYPAEMSVMQDLADKMKFTKATVSTREFAPETFKDFGQYGLISWTSHGERTVSRTDMAGDRCPVCVPGKGSREHYEWALRPSPHDGAPKGTLNIAELTGCIAVPRRFDEIEPTLDRDVLIGKGGAICVTAGYLDKHLPQLNGAFVLAGSCHSGSLDLMKAFKDKGVGCYYGFPTYMQSCEVAITAKLLSKCLSTPVNGKPANCEDCAAETRKWMNPVVAGATADRRGQWYKDARAAAAAAADLDWSACWAAEKKHTGPLGGPETRGDEQDEEALRYVSGPLLVNGGNPDAILGCPGDGPPYNEASGKCECPTNQVWNGSKCRPAACGGVDAPSDDGTTVSTSYRAACGAGGDVALTRTKTYECCGEGSAARWVDVSADPANCGACDAAINPAVVSSSCSEATDVCSSYEICPAGAPVQAVSCLPTSCVTTEYRGIYFGDYSSGIDGGSDILPKSTYFPYLGNNNVRIVSATGNAVYTYGGYQGSTVVYGGNPSTSGNAALGLKVSFLKPAKTAAMTINLDTTTYGVPAERWVDLELIVKTATETTTTVQRLQPDRGTNGGFKSATLVGVTIPGTNILEVIVNNLDTSRSVTASIYAVGSRACND